MYDFFTPEWASFVQPMIADSRHTKWYVGNNLACFVELRNDGTFTFLECVEIKEL